MTVRARVMFHDSSDREIPEWNGDLPEVPKVGERMIFAPSIRYTQDQPTFWRVRSVAWIITDGQFRNVEIRVTA